MTDYPPARQVDRAPLVQWVARWGAPQHRISFFGLNRVIGIERDSPLTNEPWSCPKGDDARAAEAEAVVDRLVRNAETYAATQSRPQTYSISAHSGSSFLEAPAVTAIPFVVVPSGEFAPSDAQDPRDVLGGLQRLLNDTLRAWGSNMQQCMDRLVDEVQILREHTRTQDKQVFTYQLERERLLDAKATREIEAEQKRLMIDVRRQGFGLGLQYLRQIIAGTSPGAPGRPPVRATDVVRFATSLTPEQSALAAPLLGAISLSQEERAELRRLTEEARPNGAPAAPQPETDGDPRTTM